VDVAVGELKLELEDELVDDARDHRRRQIREGHDRIQAVAELGREHLLDRVLLAHPRGSLAPKPMPSRAMSIAPALVVMMRMVLRKSTVLPW
jgi:hypothetical protein